MTIKCAKAGARKRLKFALFQNFKSPLFCSEIIDSRFILNDKLTLLTLSCVEETWRLLFVVVYVLKTLCVILDNKHKLLMVFTCTSVKRNPSPFQEIKSLVNFGTEGPHNQTHHQLLSITSMEESKSNRKPKREINKYYK